MTDPLDLAALAREALEMSEKATPGPWTAKAASRPNGSEGSWDYGIVDAEQTVIAEAFEKVGRTSLGFDMRPAQTNALFTVFARNNLASIARGVIAQKREIEELRTLRDKLTLEAQMHAQEARTQTATVHEIYRLVSGGTGEPGNWNGAEPVRARLAALSRAVSALREIDVIAAVSCPESCPCSRRRVLRITKAALAEIEAEEGTE